MLNYEQTVINGVPTKKHSFYAIALSDLNRFIYKDLYSSLGSGYAFNINKYVVPGFVWDMYGMVKKLPVTNRTILLDNLYFQRNTIEYDTNYYKRLWVSGFNDDPGSKLFQPLQSFYPLALDNSLSFLNQQYSISNFSFNLLVSENGENEQEPGENNIYKAAIIPIFPLFFVSSNSGHLSYGPVFMSEFEIRVSGMDNLPDVEVNCSFIGGKTLVSPETVPHTFPYIDENEKNVEFGDDEPYQIKDYKNYRTVNMSDCLVSLLKPTKRKILNMKDELIKSSGFEQSTDESTTNYVFTYKTPNKVVGMSLKISQEISLSHTTPILDDGTSADAIGPKFAALKSRSVTGSITIYNANLDDYLDKYASSSVVMYFGGNYLFHMRDVDWSNPLYSMSNNGGRFHTWNFTARISQGTGFWGGNKTAVSEFDVDYRSVLDLP
jgi:hypothetical protein